ncbi:hypothetical protein AYO22_03883 [Fonsecaea multimorphosa]|nr:hypothetical protein AYO22_03883 [Fonsecaea multimorphosa]
MAGESTKVTKSPMNWHNLGLCFAISWGLVVFGYPSAIIGTTLGEPSFLIYMGLLDPTTGKLVGNANGLIGAMSGVFQAGAALGVFLVCFSMDRWGRKAGVYCCCAFSMLGGILLTASQGVAMFIVARFFAGVGSWGFLAVAPVYASELAPPNLRGFFVGLTGVNAAFGYALASYMGLAFYYDHNQEAQWRAPLGLALIWPASYIFLRAMPSADMFRLDEARKIVFRLHFNKSDPEHEYAQEEFFQMRKQMEMDKTLPSAWLDLFRLPSYRKRTLLGMLFAFSGQSTGVLVLNNYGPTIYGLLGYGTRDQLALQCGWITVNIVGALFCSSVMDYFGRRKLVLIGLAGCVIFLCIQSAMIAEFANSGTNKAGLRMGVACSYIFLAFYSLFDTAGFVFYAELFPNHMRAKGLSVIVCTIALTDLVYLQVSATAFANIGWKFYLVFICAATVGATGLYFLLPETSGIPLEEMAKIFGVTDQVAVYLKDVHVDQNTHEVVVTGEHGISTVGGVADTKAGGDVEKEARPETEHFDM